MNIMGVIIVRLWYVLIPNAFNKITNKIKKKMMSAYRGVRVSIDPDEQKRIQFEAKCDIIIDKYKLQKLKSPFSAYKDYYYMHDKTCIWEIDVSDYNKDPFFVKPDEATNDQIREYNNLVKFSVMYKLQPQNLIEVSLKDI